MLIDAENNELACFEENEGVKHLPKKGIVWYVCINAYMCVHMYRNEQNIMVLMNLAYKLFSSVNYSRENKKSMV